MSSGSPKRSSVDEPPAEREPELAAPALVAVAVPIPVAGPLTYSVPEALRPWARPGQRVRVPVGRRRATGVIWSLREAAPAGIEPRPIERLVDLEPVLPPELMELARFAADYYLAPPGDVVAAFVPAELPSWGDRSLALTAAGALAPARDVLDRRLRERLLEVGRSRLVALLEAIPEAQLPERVELWIAEGWITDLGAEGPGRRYVQAFQVAAGTADELLSRCGRTPSGRAAVEWLGALGRPATAEEIRRETGASDAVLRRLARLGVLLGFRQVERLEIDRHLLPRRASAAAIELEPEQRGALEAVCSALAERRFETLLLHGVTGSGKTEIYLRAVERTLELGRSALLLVPEIALVPALARAAVDRFGPLCAVLHSGLGASERAQEWERLRRGEARVAVGPRSALFAPVAALGLVVVDEEQDASYKQETSPRYHGRDLALVRCRQAGAVALLVSATPSLEARHAVWAGRATPLLLSRRVGPGHLPEGILVDLRQERRVPRAGEVLFSERLLAELRRAVAEGDQAILLRNRRGYAPILLCRACGEEFRCAACGLPRTYHRRVAQLVCHWCGSKSPAPERCPSCRGETLEPIGAGTERIEEELGSILPGVSVGVLDRDSTRRIGGAAAILERFRAGATRVLVGTQMLSKGHHFPSVALTAVLAADALLGFPDFRAVERTYALLTQLAGRAGRGERPGRVVLQTYHPEHYAIQAALRHDDAAFAEQELRFRRLFDYPPFSRLVLVLSRDRDRSAALERLRALAGRIERAAGGEVRLTGPAPAPLERLKGEWRFQLLVRAASGRRLRLAVRDAMGSKPEPGLVVDVDPQQLM